MLEQTLIDRSMVNELVSLSEPDYEFFNEMTSMFFDKLNEIKELLKLDISIVRTDQAMIDSFATAFHRMKGISLNIGANQFASYCSMIERSVKMSDWDRIDDIWYHVVRCADQTEKEMQAICDEINLSRM